MTISYISKYYIYGLKNVYLLKMFQKVFKDQEGLEKAVATEEHNIKNKKVAVKKAQAKQGKVYVGKLPKDDKLSDDAIKEFFAGYGAIAAVEQPFDKVLYRLIMKWAQIAIQFILI